MSGDRRPNDDDDRDAGTPALRLDHALKVAGLTATGGQAKQRIQAGEVRVNGEVETRRKRRLHQGDVIDIDGETFEIDLEQPGADADEA